MGRAVVGLTSSQSEGTVAPRREGSRHFVRVKALLVGLEPVPRCQVDEAVEPRVGDSSILEAIIERV